MSKDGSRGKSGQQFAVDLNFSEVDVPHSEFFCQDSKRGFFCNHTLFDENLIDAFAVGKLLRVVQLVLVDQSFAKQNLSDFHNTAVVTEKSAPEGWIYFRQVSRCVLNPNSDGFVSTNTVELGAAVQVFQTDQ